MKQLEDSACFGGRQHVYAHSSDVLKCEMRFSVFLPSAASDERLPVLYWLSGLTCTEQNFITKAGAQRYAEEHRVVLIGPDTSPRGENVANDDAYDLGQGAGFYLDATQEPWSEHYRMFDYVSQELPALIEAALPVSEVRVRSFDGGPRCAGGRAQEPGSLPQRFRLRAHRFPHTRALGRKSVRRLPR